MSTAPEPSAIPAHVPASLPDVVTTNSGADGKPSVRQTQLAGALQSLLVSVTRGRSVPPLPAKSKVVELVWGKRDFSRLATDLAIDGHTLTVTCGGEVSSEVVRELRSMDDSALRGQRIDGQTEGGLVFGARFGGLSGSTAGPGTTETSVKFVQFLRGFSWHLVPDSGAPSLWLAQVTGPLEHIHGNLRVTFQRGSSSWSSNMSGLRLEGAYTYYLLNKFETEDWFLVMDTGDSGAPSDHVLWPDLLALQFSLGCQLHVGTLYGVDESGEVVAWAGGAYGADRAGSQVERPVPPVVMTTSTCTVPFFRAVSDLMRNRQDLRPGVALLAYLDALTDNVDAAFIRLAIGLESFAFWLLKDKRDENDKILVKDKAAWLAWAKEHRTEIRTMAKDEQQADILYNKIENACTTSASGKVVPDAFAASGLNLTKEMKEILDLRNYAVHTGVMLKKDQTYRLDRELAIIAKARVMLVALVARAAGYRGAIRGWEHADNEHDPIVDSFWDVSQETQEAERILYVASDSAEQPGSPVTSESSSATRT